MGESNFTEFTQFGLTVLQETGRPHANPIKEGLLLKKKIDYAEQEAQQDQIVWSLNVNLR